MLFLHSMSIAQQLMPIYNTTVHKNKNKVALNLMWLTVGWDISRPQGQGSDHIADFCTCQPQSRTSKEYVFENLWVKISKVNERLFASFVEDTGENLLAYLSYSWFVEIWFTYLVKPGEGLISLIKDLFNGVRFSLPDNWTVGLTTAGFLVAETEVNCCMSKVNRLG